MLCNEATTNSAASGAIKAAVLVRLSFDGRGEIIGSVATAAAVAVTSAGAATTAAAVDFTAVTFVATAASMPGRLAESTGGAATRLGLWCEHLALDLAK